MWIQLSNGKRIKLWFSYSYEICYSKLEFTIGKKVNRIIKYHTITTCYIDDGVFTYEGKAVCNPNDKFVKEIGRNISLDKCLKDMDYPLCYILEIKKAYQNR